MKTLALSLVLAGLPALLLAQQNCTRPGFDNASPTADNDDCYCYDDHICTACCNCWDGERVRTEDTENLDLNDVEDQDQNPVLVVDQQMLEAELQRIDDPVSAFLTSDEFTSVAPESVQDDGSSCAGVVASFGIVLLATLVAFIN